MIFVFSVISYLIIPWQFAKICNEKLTYEYGKCSAGKMVIYNIINNISFAILDMN